MIYAITYDLRHSDQNYEAIKGTNCRATEMVVH